MAPAEFLPVRPRRSSAGRRRRNVKRLPYRLGLIAPGARTVLVTPVWSDAGVRPQQVFMALVFDGMGRRVKPPSGATPRIAALLQGAFTADWSLPQTWRADTNELTERRPRPPRGLGAVAL